MNKQHYVRLSGEERAELGQLIRRNGASAFVQRRARVLLHADVGVGGLRLTDREVGAAAAVAPRTVAQIRAQFARDGLTATITPRWRSGYGPHKLDGEAGVRLVALACTDPPPGHARWTLRLLATTLVELDIVDGIAPETVRQGVKKTISSHG